jgi:hypothetical protein
MGLGLWDTILAQRIITTVWLDQALRRRSTVRHPQQLLIIIIIIIIGTGKKWRPSTFAARCVL